MLIPEGCPNEKTFNEMTFNDRFAKFKYAGYGAVDRILCFGLICVSPIPEAGKKKSSTENSSVARIAHGIEQAILQRLTPFRLRYADTGRRSEWIRADLALVLGVLGSYHDQIYRSGPTRYVSTKCFAVKIVVTNTKPQMQRHRLVKIEKHEE